MISTGSKYGILASYNFTIQKPQNSGTEKTHTNKHSHTHSYYDDDYVIIDS